MAVSTDSQSRAQTGNPKRSKKRGTGTGVVRDEFDQLQNACDPEDPCDLDDADHPRVRVGGCSAHPLFHAIL